jgi:hypothetical protein
MILHGLFSLSKKVINRENLCPVFFQPAGMSHREQHQVFGLKLT